MNKKPLGKIAKKHVLQRVVSRGTVSRRPFKEVIQKSRGPCFHGSLYDIGPWFFFVNDARERSAVLFARVWRNRL